MRLLELDGNNSPAAIAPHEAAGAKKKDSTLMYRDSCQIVKLTKLR
jgi:hypothetical protein